MSRDEILAAVRDYEAGGARPASFFTGKDAPVDPNSGVVVERLFDPYELADRISASGFSVRVAGYWGGAGGNRLVGLANDCPRACVAANHRRGACLHDRRPTAVSASWDCPGRR